LNPHFIPDFAVEQGCLVCIKNWSRGCKGVDFRISCFF
jgi:hypothetical protein